MNMRRFVVFAGIKAKFVISFSVNGRHNCLFYRLILFFYLWVFGPQWFSSAPFTSCPRALAVGHNKYIYYYLSLLKRFIFLSLVKLHYFIVFVRYLALNNHHFYPQTPAGNFRGLFLRGFWGFHRTFGVFWQGGVVGRFGFWFGWEATEIFLFGSFSFCWLSGLVLRDRRDFKEDYRRISFPRLFQKKSLGL